MEIEEGDIYAMIVDEHDNEIGFILLDEDGNEQEYYYVDEDNDGDGVRVETLSNRRLEQSYQIVNIADACNECGNCKSFCPYASAPYKDKFTLFASEADMADSTNDGFAVINPETKECKVRLLGQISDCKADDANDKLYEGLRRLICAVIDDYSYLIMK